MEPNLKQEVEGNIAEIKDNFQAYMLAMATKKEALQQHVSPQPLISRGPGEPLPPPPAREARGESATDGDKVPPRL